MSSSGAVAQVDRFRAVGRYNAGVEQAVAAELEGLLGYARAVGRAAAQHPERSDIVDGGRGYIGGALTTLLHLDLVTKAEHSEWFQRLNDELPPTTWIEA